jgi:hypothetical protein
MCVHLYNIEIDNDSYLPDQVISADGHRSQLDPFIISTRAPETCENDGCHIGIEHISAEMDFQCTKCHSGNGAETDKNESHKDMYINPGDLIVVDDTCGDCHPEEVERILKSFHATSAGVISGARYTWGAQDRDSVYSNYAVEDSDGDVPTDEGAKSKLEQIPMFADSGEYVDDYLRNQCLRCHIWTQGKSTAGDYRGSGCTACHMLYADDGKYKGSEQTINKSEPGHPIKHEITTKIPAIQCVHCHNRGGRTGVSFIGTMESDGYGTPFTEDGGKQSKLHGKNYNHLSPDIHYEKGMHCIDCHTQNEIMGNGNIYGKKEQAVEIECIDCHGTPEEYPWDSEGKVKTSGAKKANGNTYGISGGAEFSNIEKRGDSLILISKYDGAEHEIPVIKQINDASSWKTDSGEVSMAAIPHIESLECYACHVTWAPQCYGCHAKMDATSSAGDWLTGGQDASVWSESRSYLRWETPVLGINAEGKVSPYIPGCQVIFTYIDENGETKELNKVFTTVDGTSGIAQNPIQPHTISASPRTCEDCHTSKKTLGLGTGIYISGSNGLEIDFELERIVDESGNQIQATSHKGARPFNKEEQDKISRVGTCIGCHQDYSDPIWEDIIDQVDIAENPEEHKKIMNVVLNTYAEEEPILIFLATDGHDSKVYLKWNFSEPSELEHYELYWSTNKILDISNLTPNATVQNNYYTIEGLIEDTTHYFAIVAVDNSGNITGVAFSDAKATSTQEEDHREDDDDDDFEELYSNLLNATIFMVIIFIIIIILIVVFCCRKKSNTQTPDKSQNGSRKLDKAEE